MTPLPTDRMPLSAFWKLTAKRYLDAVGQLNAVEITADLREAYMGFVNICKEKDEEEMVEALWHLRFAFADYKDKIEGTTKNRVFEQTCKEYEKGVNYEEEEEEEESECDIEAIKKYMSDYGRWSAGEIDDDGNEIEDD